jgi:hypothetical protein
MKKGGLEDPMKRLLMPIAFLLPLAAVSARAHEPIINSTAAKQAAEEKRETIETNTRQAGAKTKEGAVKAETKGNTEAYRLRHAKDAAKEQWKKDHARAADDNDANTEAIE